MKVLIVSFYYSPELGAAPSRITNMAEGLRQAGYEVEVLTCLPNYPKGRIFEGYRRCFSRHETLNGVRVHRYWTYATVTKKPLLRMLSMFSFSFTLWAFALKRKRIKSYDRVIVQSPPILVACSAIMLFRKLYRRKVVLNVSDLWPQSAVELGAVREGSLYHRVLAWMERFIYRHADAFQCQSREIKTHVQGFWPQKPAFLYRNLQHAVPVARNRAKRRAKPFRIVYAGLLGVAQDVLAIVEQIDFKRLGAELHLFGGGNQAERISRFVGSHDTGVTYHGYLAKEKMVEELQRYDASIVPLMVQIKGAVPSKIFDLLPVGVPILLCGGGEAAEIVRTYGLGYVSAPGDYDALRENIRRIAGLTDEAYGRLRDNLLKASEEDFSFQVQMQRYAEYLHSL